MSLSEDECNKLNSKIIKIFKHKVHLSSIAPDCIIHADFGYKLFNLWDRQVLIQGKNLTDRINNQDLCSTTAKIRLQQLQNLFWSTQSIIDYKFIFQIK